MTHCYIIQYCFGASCHRGEIVSSLKGTWSQSCRGAVSLRHSLPIRYGPWDGEFIAQKLVNTAWTSATASQSDAALFAASAQLGAVCCAEPSQASMGMCDGKVFSDQSDEALLAAQRVGELIAQQFAKTARAYATPSQSDTALFAIPAELVERFLGEFIVQPNKLRRSFLNTFLALLR